MKEFMKNNTNFFRLMFTAESGISSKRVSGFTGWIVFMGIIIYCTINNQEAPVITDTLAICSTALLGIESVTSIWRKDNFSNNNDNLINYNYGKQ